MSTVRAAAAAAALLALASTACAPIPSSSDPFADAGGAERRGADERLYRVRLEVACEGCMVTYSVAGRATSEPATTPIWRRSLDRNPRFPEAIRLVASGNVARVRIYVNGEVAASAESGPGDDNHPNAGGSGARPARSGGRAALQLRALTASRPRWQAT